MRPFTLLVFAAAALTAEPLTLRQALRTALEKHPGLAAANADVDAAGSRVAQARSALLPRASYTESVQRSNNPVFAFSSLLSQRRFTAANFAIDRLNNPDFVNNFQSRVGVEQTVWDAGRTRNATELARLGVDAAKHQRDGERLQIAGKAAQAWLGVQLATEAAAAADAAVASAEADLVLARNKRDAGLSTDVDVLAIEVHLAEARAAQVRWREQSKLAAFLLNEAIGVPLDTPVEVPFPGSSPGSFAVSPLSSQVADFAARPEISQAKTSLLTAEARVRSRTFAFWPQLIALGSFEANRGRPFSQGAGMWFAGATLRWDFFNGFRDQHALAEEKLNRLASASRLEATTRAVALDATRSHIEYTSAAGRLQAVGGAVAMAEEVVRIARNRFSAGLATAADLLRHETALTNAKLAQHQAVHDVRLAAIAMELASGRLNPDSEVYQ
ncbi:MAG: TolC family protein [Bryobacteraceae bacterium]|nr:TolC family protein [Bryobacteraceae bacterium]